MSSVSVVRPPKHSSPFFRSHELVVIGFASLVLVLEALKVAHRQASPMPDQADWIFAFLAGLQMLAATGFRVPIAPGKWLDFTYVPLWVIAFSLQTPYALFVLCVFSLLIYFIFPDQFTCRKTFKTYLFHFSYQVILFYVTVKSFWLVKGLLESGGHAIRIGDISLAGIVGMAASMFALVLTDSLLGGCIQLFEGQTRVWEEWKQDYLRIAATQTTLGSAAMLFAVLYAKGHYIQLLATYGFLALAAWLIYRGSLRRNDYVSLMRAMINLIEVKDSDTRNHSEAVGHYSTVIGQRLGFSASRLERLSLAAQLHDVGKIGIPDAVLKKTEGLTDEEFAQMKTHPQLGEKMLEPIASLRREARIIGRHHERVDGKGYPYGEKQDDIPMESRIIFIADAYQAMISRRPYRKGLGTNEALHRLQQSKGSQFDPELVDLFVDYVKAPARHIHRFRPFCLVH